MAQGLIIFDFDGLILDTESPELFAWQKAYDVVGQDFDLEHHLQTIGTWNGAVVSSGELLRRKLADEDLYARAREVYQQVFAQAMAEQPLQAGVLSLIEKARALGLQIAVGSSSTADWVLGHLERFQIRKLFDTIVTFSDVGEGKPSPKIFLRVLANLSVPASQAIVLEDSQNGVLAAHRAEIRAIAVPNLVTARQDFSLAFEVIPSLEVLALEKYFPG